MLLAHFDGTQYACIENNRLVWYSGSTPPSVEEASEWPLAEIEIATPRRVNPHAEKYYEALIAKGFPSHTARDISGYRKLIP